jgi:hypothetical protein
VGAEVREQAGEVVPEPDQLDPVGELAGGINAGPQLGGGPRDDAVVRDPGHDDLGAQRPDRRVRAVGLRRGAPERLALDLGGRGLQRPGHGADERRGGRDLPLLDPPDEAERHAGEIGELLLGQAAQPPELRDPLADRFIGHSGPPLRGRVTIHGTRDRFTG